MGYAAHGLQFRFGTDRITDDGNLPGRSDEEISAVTDTAANTDTSIEPRRRQNANRLTSLLPSGEDAAVDVSKVESISSSGASLVQIQLPKVGPCSK